MNVYEKIGYIKRAREDLVYQGNGKKWVDFYRIGGRALWGHNPGTMAQRIKNELSLARYFDQGANQTHSLHGLIHSLFPNHRLAALGNLNHIIAQSPSPSPEKLLESIMFNRENRYSGSVYSPVLGLDPMDAGDHWVIPILPFPVLADGYLLLAPKAVNNGSKEDHPITGPGSSSLRASLESWKLIQRDLHLNIIPRQWSALTRTVYSYTELHRSMEKRYTWAQGSLINFKRQPTEEQALELSSKGFLINPWGRNLLPLTMGSHHIQKLDANLVRLELV